MSNAPEQVISMQVSPLDSVRHFLLKLLNFHVILFGQDQLAAQRNETGQFDSASGEGSLLSASAGPRRQHGPDKRIETRLPNSCLHGRKQPGGLVFYKYREIRLIPLNCSHLSLLQPLLFFKFLTAN